MANVRVAQMPVFTGEHVMRQTRSIALYRRARSARSATKCKHDRAKARSYTPFICSDAWHAGCIELACGYPDLSHRSGAVVPYSGVLILAQVQNRDFVHKQQDAR